VVALHRGYAAAALNVPLGDTWAAGCHVGPVELGAAGSSVAVKDEQMTLQSQGNDVVVAVCR
jgi:hypothetical protein